MRKGTTAARIISRQRKVNPSLLRHVEKLDWRTRDFAHSAQPSVTQDSRNAFERVLLLSQEQLHHLELRACFANARERQPDPGGNIWHDHVSVRDGSRWVFCVDHETSAIFGDIYSRSATRPGPPRTFITSGRGRTGWWTCCTMS